MFAGNWRHVDSLFPSLLCLLAWPEVPGWQSHPGTWLLDTASCSAVNSRKALRQGWHTSVSVAWPPVPLMLWATAPSSGGVKL